MDYVQATGKRNPQNHAVVALTENHLSDPPNHAVVALTKDHISYVHSLAKAEATLAEVGQYQTDLVRAMMTDRKKSFLEPQGKTDRSDGVLEGLPIKPRAFDTSPPKLAPAPDKRDQWVILPKDVPLPLDNY